MIRLFCSKVSYCESPKSLEILRSLPKGYSIDKFEQYYNQYLEGIKNSKNLKMDKIYNLGLFPFKSFRKFPKYSIERFLKSSYEVIKSNRQANTIDNYNSMLLSYMKNKINCDVSAILNDMNNNNIQFNKYTYYILVKLYSNQGDVDSMQNIVNVMKDNGLKIFEYTKCIVYGGFIRAKQFDRAEQFFKQENLKENDLNILIVKCKAFADIGYFKEMVETLKLISEINSDLPSMISLDLYIRLIKAGSSYSNLNEIFAMANEKEEDDISNIIFKLNREGFYNHSLMIMLKFSELFVSRNNNRNIIMSFCSKDCPINVYKTVLEKFIGRLGLNYRLDLFSNMDFKTSLKLLYDIMNVENSGSITSNLLIKAVNEKSIKNIQTVLSIMDDKLSYYDLGQIIQYALIPVMLNNNIISKPYEILDVLPDRKEMILANLFMYYLCKGDLASYELLMNEHIINQRLIFSSVSNISVLNILHNIPFIELKKVAILLSKVFVRNFVNKVITRIVLQRIIQLSNDDNVIAIKEAIEMANNLDVTFRKESISILVKKAPKHASLFDQLEITEELLDN